MSLFNASAADSEGSSPDCEWLFRDPACQQELTRLTEKLRSRIPTALTMVGVSGREGVTSVTLNLAHAFATVERSRTLVVDANLRYPAVHRLVGVPLEGGLSDWNGTGDPEYRPASASPNLWFLTAGAKHGATPLPESRRLLASVRERARSTFSVVFFDAPPIVPYSDALALARISDGILLVAESDETSSSDLVQAQEQFADIGANVIAVILNRTGRYIPKWLR